MLHKTQRKELSSRAERFSDRQQRIFSFLQDHPIGVLSTVDPNNDPHGVVVYYMIANDFTVHILTKRGTRKYDNLMHNDHVCLTVFEPRTQTTVHIEGIAAERGGSNPINQVAGAIFGAALRTSESDLPPIVKLQAGAFTTFKIKPVQARMAVYSRPDPGTSEELFEIIETFDLIT